MGTGDGRGTEAVAPPPPTVAAVADEEVAAVGHFD